MSEGNILLIQVLANIGTFISSLVAIFTIYEMKKQREGSLRPDIVVENISNIYINENNNNDSISIAPYTWRIDKKDQPPEKEIKSFIEGTFDFKLYNIGLEVAKNINITWNFDIEYFVTFLAKYQSEDFKFYFDDDYNSDLLLLADSGLIRMDGLNHNYYFEYMRNYDNNIMKVDFCLIYNKLVSFWLFMKCKNELENKDEIVQLFEEFKNLPKLEMHIKYSDISNKIYHKTYVFDYSIICFTKSEIVLQSLVTSENKF